MKDVISFAEAFSSDAYFVVNKRLLRKFGPETAIFLSNLIDKMLMLNNKGLLEEDGGFFQTFEQQEEETGLTITRLRTCKRKLIEQQILYVKMRGIPPKEWYFLDFSVLKKILYPNEINTYTIPQDTLGIILRKPEELSYGNLRNNNNNLFNNNLKITNTCDFSKKITISQFETFWKDYPKKTDKGKAQTAWNKLCGKKDAPSLKTILKAIQEQKQTQRWKKGFIPMPTTWLNQSRWLDDPAEMVDYGTNKLNTPQTSILRTRSVIHKKTDIEI